MKGVKTAVVFIMIFLMAFACFGCGKSNSTETTGGGSSGVGPGEQPGTDEKVTLLFEIDEGLGGYEFVAGCKKPDGSYDFDKMDVILNNVYDGVKGLQDKYNVALHIYPEWYYKESGWTDERTDGMQKWSDDFLYAMDFCKEKGLEVYLEILSSTIYVCQNGENGSLPSVNINHGISDTPREVWGCSCDFESLRALKREYPDTFTGLRFHELIGTEALAATGNKHACRIYEEDIYAIADEVKNLGIKLMWSDQTWGHCFKISSFSYWLNRVDVVKEKLGDDLILTFANNTDDVSAVTSFAVYDSLVSRFENTVMGYSNQAWFLDALVLNDTKCEDQPYIPVEIVAGFAQKAILRGAKFVQFEPYFHLFNYTRQGINGGTDYNRGGIAMNFVTPRYEEIQGDALDYSPRSEMYRLVDYLNSDTFDFANVEDFYDTASGKIKTDSINDPPKMYQQATVMLRGERDSYFDKYNGVPDKWLEQNENRYTARVMDKNAVCIGRISYTVGGFDDILTVTVKDGKKVGTIYNCISGKVYEDKTTFVDNSDGEVIGFTTVNLVKAKSYRGKDTDEIIVFRKKDGKINLHLYTANMSNDGFNELTGASSSVIEDFFGTKQLDAEGFVGVYGVRNSKAIGKTSYLRNIDGLIAVYADGNSVNIIGKRRINSSDINTSVSLSGKVLCAGVGDVDLDINSADELIIVTESGSGSSAYAFSFTGDKAFSAGKQIAQVGDTVKSVSVFGKFYYQNDSNL